MKRTIINSLSGGKTSSYLAAHNTADHDLFALVCVDDTKCAHSDKMIMQYANDKLSNYASTFGEVQGTAENPIIMKTMMDLEQMLGREITWVRGFSMDKVIELKKSIPSQQNRFCTTETKMRPIFNWCYMNTDLPISMRVGFRWDEKERKDRFTTDFDTSFIANKGKTWRHKHTNVEWRVGQFPLIANHVHHLEVHNYWKDKAIKFPKDSNCQFCFWKDTQQILRNSVNCPSQIDWAENIEKKMKRRFRFDLTISQIKTLPMQLDFFETDGAGCNSGECLA